MGAEQDRLAAADGGSAPWRAWGPYVAARAWGTVREDYSPDGSAWTYFPHDAARSRAYRWSEDALAGVCDEQQTWCLGLALWNGQDPILKERAFGLSGPEGRHGEDVKDYWWYLDNTPTHSWMRWRYHYPQAAFPYEALLAGNAERSLADPEFELGDTGAFGGDRFWVVTVDYAKAAPEDLLMRVTVENAGPDAATLHLLPTLWFRNTWSWGQPDAPPEPSIALDGQGRLRAAHRDAGVLTLAADGDAEPLFCDNETNAAKLFPGAQNRSAYPKDGFGEHLLTGADTVNPQPRGTKAALHYRLAAAPGARVEIRVRLVAGAPASVDLGGGFGAVLAQREAEADEWHAALAPSAADAEDRLVLRQAVAGLLWSKQFYAYDVGRWLAGDPAYPPPARTSTRNTGWAALNAHDVIVMPDTWEYPWFAGWDLAFHAVALAHVDPALAKSQLLLLGGDRYRQPDGQLPAYEWDFGDVNPPVQAWAALRVYEIDGGADREFLRSAFEQQQRYFQWWSERRDADGNNIFEGGFLGLDNISPFNRDAVPADAGRLEESDATAWMALFCLSMLEISLELALHDPAYEESAAGFFDRFAQIGTAACGLWDAADGFYYDVLHTPQGVDVPIRARSLVGLLPLAATTVLRAETVRAVPGFAAHIEEFTAAHPEHAAVVGGVRADGTGGTTRLLAVAGRDELVLLLRRMFDPAEFLSDHGLRSVSAALRGQPVTVDLPAGSQRLEGYLDYEPGDSESGMFGGNSNWRGPVWMPPNYVLSGALRRYAAFFGDSLTVPDPAGTGPEVTLAAAADELDRRLIGLFRCGPDGRRPAGGAADLFTGPRWSDLIWFNEFFHGDTGAGLGASHQTGWTALVLNLIIGRQRGELGSR